MATAPSVAAASLRGHDGSAGVLVDTSIWIDCIDRSSAWHKWAVKQLQVCSERYPLHVNLIIYTELLVPGPDVAELDAMLDVYDTLRSGLPWACAALTAKPFAACRRKGGVKLLPMPDFYIGAHAAVANLRVLTRDPVATRATFQGWSCLGPRHCLPVSAPPSRSISLMS